MTSLVKPASWVLPFSGLSLFYGLPESPRLSHYFLPRALLQGRRVLYVDGANRFDPLFLGRMARQKGSEAAGFSERVRVARAFTCFQLTELLVRMPRLLEKFAADALIVTGLPELYFDEDVHEREAYVSFRRALTALGALRCFLTLHPSRRRGSECFGSLSRKLPMFGASISKTTAGRVS